MSQRIIELLEKRTRPLLSIEFFPPKDLKGFALLGSAIERIRAIHPDFVSVTYGAGGTTRERTTTVTEILKIMGFDPIMPHLTCVGSGQKELEEVTDRLYDAGHRNIMALRGDLPEEGTFPEGALCHASDLVKLIHDRHPDICCGVAGYPETHPEAESSEADIRYLKEKLDAGGDFITTQLFFDNALYFDFVERCRAAGINQPIIPGLLPAISLKQISRIMTLCKASFPEELRTAMEQAGGSGADAESVGIEWTVKQIHELLEKGAPGIHLYILNRAKTALAPALQECLVRWR